MTSKNLLVVGTIAFDNIETPLGKIVDALGGSSVYFSLAASLFTNVRLVGVVGEDFPKNGLDLLQKRGIDLAGVERAKGETFRWAGLYEGDMNQAKTLDTKLNVIDGYQPKVPKDFQGSDFVFLANAPPKTQLAVLKQMKGTPFVAADSMNLWIEIARPELLSLLTKIDLFIINEGESRLLTGERKIIRAGRKILELGPKMVMIKAGEHGAFLFAPGFEFALPAYPTGNVQDPTGAGDSFAGGAVGYLASCDKINESQLRLAMAYGTIASSFVVEQFGVAGMKDLSREAIEARFREFEHFIRL